MSKLTVPKLRWPTLDSESHKSLRALFNLIRAAAVGLIAVFGAYVGWDGLTKTGARLEARSWLGLGAPRAVTRFGGEPTDYEVVSLGATVKNAGTETAKRVRLHVGTLADDGAVHSQPAEQPALAPTQIIEAKLDLNGLASNGVMLCATFDGGVGTSHWRLFWAYDSDNWAMGLRDEGVALPWQDVERICDEQMRAFGPLLADWNRRHR